MSREYHIKLDLFVAVFLILFTAKIFGFLTISWWWIVLPLLIPFMVLALIGIIFGIVLLVDRVYRHRN